MISSERAKEILKLGSKWGNFSKFVTKRENEEITNLWKSMPGYTCWYDALCRFAYPKKEQ